MATEKHWKDKYLNTLDKTEAIENRLKDAEEMLRLTVSRLTLTGSGADSELDRQLDKLKKLTRNSPDNSSIRSLLDQISVTIKRLDIELAAKKPQRLPPHQFLALVIERIRFPKTLDKKGNALRKKLGQRQASFELDKHLTSFVELINDALASDNSDFDQKSVTKSGGDQSKDHQDIADEASDQSWVCDELIELIRAKFITNTKLDSACIEVESARTKKEINRALAELVHLLPDDIDPQNILPPIQSRPDDSNFNRLEPNRISPEKRFSALLHKLSLPKNLVGRADKIQLQLNETLSENEWPPVLSNIADLVSDMRSEVERERSELQAFLFQITAELQTIDSSLTTAEAHRLASFQSGEQLDNSVKSDLSELQTSVESETDINSLRQIISTRMEKISDHLRDYRDTESRRQQELSTELKSLRSRVQNMESETSELNQKLALEREQARTDPLTGINNRIAYQQRLGEEYERWALGKTGLSIIVCDVDHFKKLNDTLGHQAGDRALQSIATVLKQNVRKSDLLARYGGEEFVVLVSHDANAEDSVAKMIAEKIRVEVEQAEFKSKGERVPVTISCGYSSFEDGDDIDAAFDRADKNLYRAKELGRNRVEG